MCGIFGYIGEADPLEECVKGLTQLEYRGYDSTGIAGIRGGRLAICKEIGKLSMLKKKLNLESLELAIGHTRWATHGGVTQENAHPHSDMRETLALVHNGIIENYGLLREKLRSEGTTFLSETDTEVIVQLIARFYQGDLVRAVHQVLALLKGHFAIALIHRDHPNQIVAASRGCPLSIGIDEQGAESILSSDPNAFLGKNLHVLFLRSDEVALMQKGKVEVFDQNQQPVVKKTVRLEGQYKAPSKEGFEHFMLKEIYEQPSTVQKAMLGRLEEGQVQFEALPEEFREASSVWFIACGTSCHAGAIGSLFLEDLAGIPAHAEIASEARYRIVPPGALVVAISQSGETADTLAAVREMKRRGLKVLGLCNVKNSTLTRETDASIFLNAGTEVSVCSTKAFTSQIAVLYLFALYMARRKGGEALKEIPAQIQQVLEQAPHIAKLAKKYSRYNNFFFMGRHYMFPTCLEAALKLKEISYVNANGYPAGELKHGPIALIDTQFPVIAFCTNQRTEEKILSNLQEVKARGAPTLALASEHSKEIGKVADDLIWLPPTTDELAPFAATVAGQLLAYFIAKERGCDIDQPRNLAKSVTVE